MYQLSGTVQHNGAGERNRLTASGDAGHLPAGGRSETRTEGNVHCDVLWRPLAVLEWELPVI